MKKYAMKDLDLMIDEPEYLEPVEVWQAWLEDLRKSEDHPAIRKAIKFAESVIPDRIAFEQELQEIRKAQAQEAQAA
jgi:hypothetical protein